MQMGLKPAFYKYAWGVNEPGEAERETRIQTLQLVCCRRDSAALQVVIAADDDYLLTTSGETVFWKAGPLTVCRLEVELMPALAVDVKLIGLVEDTDRLLKSDPILDQRAMFVPRRRLQQVWVECHTSAQTPSGTYEGTVRLYAHTLCDDEEPVAVCSFTAVVKDLLLPEPRDYRFYLDLFQHPSNIARHYQVALWSDAHFHLLDAYLASMAQLGQKAASVFVSEIPYIGQRSYKLSKPSDLFEYSMVRAYRGRDGQFRYDFSAMDRYVALAQQHGIVETIDMFGLVSVWQDREAGYGPIVEGSTDAVRVRYLDEAAHVYRFMRTRDQLDHFTRALESHVIEQGWTERVRLIADEPADVNDFQQQLDHIRAVAPAFVCRIAINHVEFIQRDLRGVVDYVPILNAVADEYDRLLELKRRVAGRILYYVCCWPDRPNSFIGSPSIECRVLPWLVERLGLDGFLKWAFTAWVERPFEDLDYMGWPFGDMLFVYPGAGGRPVPSLRYKWLQRGIRDYEVMQMLKSQGSQERVTAALDRVFRFDAPSDLSPSRHKLNAELYSLDPVDYERLLVEL